MIKNLAHDINSIDEHRWNKGIGDDGSTADIRMIWSAMVCLGLLLSALDGAGLAAAGFDAGF